MEATLKKIVAELVGTFALVLIGTGAIVVNDLTGGSITHLGVSLAFGAIVMTMIYAVGDVSGAHLNPAVTIGFWFAGRFPRRMLLPYIAAQAGGALLASVLIRFWFPAHEGLGMTVPSGDLLQSFSLEIVLTFMLMFVILGVATGAKEKGVVAGIAIGGTVALAALVGGPVSGASMNPARSLGPAVVAGDLTALWIYFLAPVVGGLAAVLMCRCVREPGCCRARLLDTGV